MEQRFRVWGFSDSTRPIVESEMILSLLDHLNSLLN